MLPAKIITKYGFRIRTRSGMLVEHLMIHGRDQADAQRKLEQMYRHCQVLECKMVPVPHRMDPAASFEDVLSLVAK
jgi:hypothetical protein